MGKSGMRDLTLTDSVRSVELFDLHELELAYRLLLPQAVANQAAQDWFALFADEVNEAGRYVYTFDYEDGSELTGSDPGRDSGLAISPVVPRHDYSWLFSLSMEERVEVVMRMSTFVLDLVSFVSPDMNRRVESTDQDDVMLARERRREMLKVVQQLQP
jgi:hypothetical protein